MRENGLLGGAYIRPIAFRGYGEMGVAGNIDQPASVSVAAWEWGSYLGEGGLEQGVDVCVSSWQRVAPNTVPALAKAGGNYLSSALVTLEARRLGFAEGLALEHGGLRQRRRRRESVLGPGRQAVHAARRVVDPVRHHAQHRHAARRGRRHSPCSSRTFRASCLYIADEVFLTGTAAEITPVRSVDKIPVGEGKRGPITERLQKLFFGLFDGTTADRWDWLEPIVDQKAGPHAVPSPSEDAAVQSLFEKIWASHVVVPETDDTPAVLVRRPAPAARGDDAAGVRLCCAPRACRCGARIAASRRSITRRRPCRSRR